MGQSSELAYRIGTAARRPASWMQLLRFGIAGASLQPLTSQAIAVAVAMPFNFIGNKLWTFSG
jgi:hypothetical protein